ncbi:hypothetical protein Geob_2725 [Geotalea daltonii FRC-32]|uniref:Uncharacterized protein n=1 Tax=Geotalea daltonii (strain DSM 22248 / JCM 15807 / FRC-32) TaxID=316067 RepID=B9M1J3_GEODF|nr:hypothetical protein [Geotalea daltonii]ACM21075.1 hypothetical protein Geob_2725 [Geotalea daltonii FRC-32]
MPNLTKHKINFTERFKRRHALRFHMSLILLATFSSGLLATKLMLVLDMTNVMWRYPLAVVFAYGVFFASVKIWLHYISPSAAAKKAHDSHVDAVDLLPDLPISGGGSPNITPAFEGGGGEFSGAGASGTFEVDGLLADTGSSPIMDGGVDTGSGIGNVVGDAAGDVVGAALGDEGGCLVAVILGVLAAMLAVLVGTGAYLVYEAPFILSEAAFEFILAASLLRGTKRMNSGDWWGSVFKTTSIPFLATLALAFLAGYLMHRYFPGVTKISELVLLW